MITYYFFILLIALIAGIISPITFLPDVVLSPGIATGLAAAGNYIAIGYGFAPSTITALFAVVGIVVVIEAAIGAYKVVKWVYSKIPGIS